MSVQRDTPYVFLHPDGTRAVVGNDATARADTDWCGFAEDISGLESAEVRGSGDPIPEGDGGIPGNYYDGERPFTFLVIPAPDPSPTLNQTIDKLLHVVDCRRQDGRVDWTETGRAQTRLWYRKATAPRWEDINRPKKLRLSLVSANSRILSSTEHSSGPSTSHTISNAGMRETLPRFAIASPTSSVSLTNNTTGETFTFTGLSGSPVVIDFNPPYPELNQGGTITLGTPGISGGTRKSGAVAFPSSVWWALQKGSNSISCSSAATIYWRDAW